MTPAPTVAELNAERTDSLRGLIEFVAALPTSHEAAILYALIGAMFVGMFASWCMKYAVAKAIDDSLVDYFFRSHTRRTFGTICVYMGVCATAISTGVFDNAGTFVGWYNVLWVGITNAFGADMGVNKGSQGAWTEAQRLAARAPQDAPK